MRNEHDANLALAAQADKRPQWTVVYSGFLQTVTRRFNSRHRAEQWARQVGIFNRCTIARV